MIEDKFNAAVNVIRSLPKDGPYQPSHDMMLKFYGLYKQATQGPCMEPKPSFYEVVKGYKWKAWSNLGAMSKKEAMSNYVEELKKIVETMAYSENVAAFMEALGPFYEYVDLPNVKNSDSNHNITDKGPDQSSQNFKMISLCNGKGNPTMNGTHTSDDSEPNEDSGVKPKLSSGSQIANGFKKDSPQKTDLKFNNELVNGRIPVMNGISPLNSTAHSCINGSFSHSPVNLPREEHMASLMKKFTSDTESDDEYSEPAESPELLKQKQRLKASGTDAMWDSSNLSPPQSETGSPVLQIVTCGGGDAADAGRIRLTHSYQFQEASGNGRGYMDTNFDQASLPFCEGPPSGRRRRDSDNPRGSEQTGPSMDINSQLIRILQKIHLDLEAVLARLDTLESHTLNQHHQICQLCKILEEKHKPTFEESPGPMPSTTPPPTLTDNQTGMDNTVRILTQKDAERQVSIFAQPDILAAFIGGAVTGLLFAILLVMFIVYRMRKRDEGSYPLDEPKRVPLTSSYSPNDKEIFA